MKRGQSPTSTPPKVRPAVRRRRCRATAAHDGHEWNARRHQPWSETSWSGGRPPPPPRRRFEPENRRQEVMNVKITRQRGVCSPGRRSTCPVRLPVPSEHRTYDARRPRANAATPARSRTRTRWRREPRSRMSVRRTRRHASRQCRHTRTRRTTRCDICRGNSRMRDEPDRSPGGPLAGGTGPGAACGRRQSA